jgi:hypothetical protein
LSEFFLSGRLKVSMPVFSRRARSTNAMGL